MHDKVNKLVTAQVKEISTLFGLTVSGNKDALIDTLVTFLNAPYDTKKPVIKVRSLHTQIDLQKRRSSGKVGKPVTKKKSPEKIKVSKKVTRFWFLLMF